MIPNLSVVKLKKEELDGIKRGAVFTVVQTYNFGMYEVEFLPPYLCTKMVAEEDLEIVGMD